MFTNMIPDESPKLDEAIDRLLDAIAGVECTSKEHAQLTAQLTSLYKIKEINHNIELKRIESLMKQEDLAKNFDLKSIDQRRNFELKQLEFDLKSQETEATVDLRRTETTLKQMDVDRHNRISRETIAMIAANLLGIALIIGHERVNVITTKALGFVTKMK